MLRVLFLNSRSEYGGADMGLLGIVRYLDRQQIQSIVLLPVDGPLVRELEAAGAEVRFLDICRLERLSSPGELADFVRRFWSSFWLLHRLIRAESIDLVYTNSSAIQVGALAARLAGVPNLWHIREIWTSPRWLTGPLYRYAYAMADGIIAISRAVALSDFGRDDGKVHVIRDGIDAGRFAGVTERAAGVRAQFGLKQPWPIVSTVARMVPQKGLTTFVEAARRVRDAGLDAYFCLAGDIPRPMYQAYKDALTGLITRYGLEERVRLLGWIDDVPALLAASELCVLASIGPEGAGLIIPESWLAGIPVIAPNHSGPGELVRHGENGFLFQAGDAEDLSARIVELLRQPDQCRQMAEAGRRDAKALHDAGRNADCIAGIITALVEKRRQR